jgi:hypothetical protein
MQFFADNIFRASRYLMKLHRDLYLYCHIMIIYVGQFKFKLSFITKDFNINLHKNPFIQPRCLQVTTVEFSRSLASFSS